MPAEDYFADIKNQCHAFYEYHSTQVRESFFKPMEWDSVRKIINEDVWTGVRWGLPVFGLELIKTHTDNILYFSEVLALVMAADQEKPCDALFFGGIYLLGGIAVYVTASIAIPVLSSLASAVSDLYLGLAALKLAAGVAGEVHRRLISPTVEAVSEAVSGIAAGAAARFG